MCVCARACMLVLCVCVLACFRLQTTYSIIVLIIYTRYSMCLATPTTPVDHSPPVTLRTAGPYRCMKKPPFWTNLCCTLTLHVTSSLIRSPAVRTVGYLLSMILADVYSLTPSIMTCHLASHRDETEPWHLSWDLITAQLNHSLISRESITIVNI